MNLSKHKLFITYSFILIAVMLLPQHMRELLYLDIEHFMQGEYWRFFSAHFTHISWVHCLSNIIGVLLLAGIFNQSKQTLNWSFATFLICTLVSTGLILFSTQLDWYVGFSGVLTGLYIYAAIKTIRDNIKISTIIIIALSIYILFQVLEGELISTTVMTDIKTSSYAHAFGFVTGLIYGSIEQLVAYCSIRFRNKY
ncbi:MAG: rhombosortase [Gammaproteobacteria bacterium]